MDEYTPTTQEVETHWADVGFAGDRESFRRWLLSVTREASAKAWHEGFCRGEVSGAREFPLNPKENPYR